MPNVAIFVSQQSHCLLDLLGRVSNNELRMNVPLIISNHNELKDLCSQFNSQYITASKIPLTTLGLENMYDIYVNTHGGGLRGQADAIQLGIARALCYMSPENRASLKAEGFLTRDSRRKERKKYGLRKARKAPQFSKR